MTNEEIITEIKLMRKFNYTLAPIEVFDKAIEALEKQIPIKPYKDIYYKCPSCNKEVLRGRRCDNNDCGQAIDWS